MLPSGYAEYICVSVSAYLSLTLYLVVVNRVDDKDERFRVSDEINTMYERAWFTICCSNLIGKFSAEICK